MDEHQLLDFGLARKFGCLDRSHVPVLHRIGKLFVSVERVAVKPRRLMRQPEQRRTQRIGPGRVGNVDDTCPRRSGEIRRAQLHERVHLSLDFQFPLAGLSCPQPLERFADPRA